MENENLAYNPVAPLYNVKITYSSKVFIIKMLIYITRTKQFGAILGKMIFFYVHKKYLVFWLVH